MDPYMHQKMINLLFPIYIVVLLRCDMPLRMLLYFTVPKSTAKSAYRRGSLSRRRKRNNPIFPNLPKTPESAAADLAAPADLQGHGRYPPRCSDLFNARLDERWCPKPSSNDCAYNGTRTRSTHLPKVSKTSSKRLAARGT